jgi:hypothetical protein
MQQVAVNGQIRRSRVWITVATSSSRHTLRPSIDTKTISGLRIMSTRVASPSMNIHRVQTTTATLAPLLASENENIFGERSNWNGNKNSMWSNTMAAVMTAVFGAALVKMNEQQKSNTECCGIAGVVGSSKNHDARYVVVTCPT